MRDLPKTRNSLILRLKSHDDADAWEEFCQIYEPLILRIGQRKGLQAADAADLAQDVFIRVAKSVQHWEPNEQKGSFRGWIGSIARNLVIDLLRRQNRKPAISGEPHINAAQQPVGDEDLFDLEYEKQLFLWAAEKIRPSFAENTWLAFWQTTVESMSIEDVARQIGMSKGAIYIARSRIIAKLRKKIEFASDQALSPNDTAEPGVTE